MFLESEKAARWSSGRLCAALWGGLQLTNAVEQTAVLLHRTNKALNKQILLHSKNLLTFGYRKRGAVSWTALFGCAY